MWRIIGLLALLLAGCAPLAITNVQVQHDSCDQICLTWETSQPAQCKVTYCVDNLCYTSPVCPDYLTSHCINLPVRHGDITITAIGHNGTANYEVKE